MAVGLGWAGAGPVTMSASTRAAKRRMVASGPCQSKPRGEMLRVRIGGPGKPDAGVWAAITSAGWGAHPSALGTCSAWALPRTMRAAHMCQPGPGNHEQPIAMHGQQLREKGARRGHVHLIIAKNLVSHLWQNIELPKTAV